MIEITDSLSFLNNWKIEMQLLNLTKIIKLSNG